MPEPPLYPPNLNARAHPMPLPPHQQGISIHDIVAIRAALDSFKFQSKDTSESLKHLDHVINVFTTSLNPGEPKS